MRIYHLFTKNLSCFFLSLFCVFAFSSSWIVIAKQVKSAGFLWPLSLRFFLASFFLLLWSYYKGKNISMSSYQKKLILLQSILMYSLNFIAIYAAAKYLYSGVNAMISASVALFNVFISSLLFKKSLQLKLVFSAILGLFGLSLILSLDYLHIINNGIS